jgi:hypothetical protein
MFIQIVQGRVADEQRLRSQLDRWLDELQPGAVGWLGGTYGLTDDGMFVGVVRFESEEAARRNAARSEQGRWWQETSECFTGDVTFHDCPEVHVMLRGGADDAGFVQVMQGKVRDKDKLQQLESQVEPMLSQHRPDIVGWTLAIEDDGSFTETVAFTSEDAARRGEQQEMTPEMRRMFEEEMAAMGEVSYLDLHHPWFATAGAR